MHDQRGHVVITGGSGAIGQATIVRFAAAGWRTKSVDLVPLDVSGLLLHEGDPRPSWAQVDLSDESATASAIQGLVGDRAVQHLVAIAGGAVADEQAGSPWDLPSAAVFRSSLDNNLISAYVAVRQLLPNLRTAEGDRSITLCSSINALGAWSYPAYSASKSGLLGLARVLARALGPEGIRCNAVVPGSVDTPALDGRSVVPEKRDRLLATVPLGRLASTQDIADAFYAIAVDLRHVTGHVLVVDGGQEINRWNPPELE